jgi:hypothetical protein
VDHSRSFLRGLHEVVGHAHRVVGVLKEDRLVGLAVERAVVARVDERPRLLLFLGLAANELLDVRVIDVEDHHLGRSSRLAARLDHAREGIEALHETDRARRRAAAVEQFLRRANGRQIRAGARAVLEQHALGLGQAQDGLHGVLDAVDETGRTLWLCLDAHVEPNGRVEGHLLLDQQVLELGAVVVGRSLVGKVPVLRPPSSDGVGHAVDELAHGALAFGCTQLATEVLLHDHVGRGLTPAAGNLDIALLEHNLAALADDAGRALLPDHARVAIVAGPREESLDLNPRGLLAVPAATDANIFRGRWAWDWQLKPIGPRVPLTSAILLVKHQHSSSAMLSRLQGRRAGFAVCTLALTLVTQ